MRKTIHTYCEVLKSHKAHRLYLIRNSGLPESRMNIDLAKAFAQTAGLKMIKEFTALSPM